MVVVDHDSTKGLILCPCTKKETGMSTFAQLYHQYVYKRYGLPDGIISDRGPQFSSKVFNELCRLLGIKHSMSTAYHPQTDGQTERANQEIEAMLRIFCANNPEDWYNLIPDIEFAYNSREHSTIKMAPFYAAMGYHPTAIPAAYNRTNIPAVEERLDELKKARNEADAAIELARQHMVERVTRRFKPFKKGQRVWLEGKNLKTGYPHKKLAPKREGPFVIDEVFSRLVYKLKLPRQWRVHPVFHASLLSPYNETHEHGDNYKRPPPDLIDGEEEQEIEAIINHRSRRSGKQYLVTWLGFPTEENEWLDESDFDNAQSILKEYKRRRELD